MQSTSPGTVAAQRASRQIRAAMFYPWEDFAERRSGASLRCNLLVDHLAPHLGRIRVLQSGQTPVFRRGTIEVGSVRKPWHVVLLRRVSRLLVFPLLGRAGFGQELYLWHHLDRRFDPAFKRRVRDLVRESDVVLLEYSFWAHTVLRACRDAGIPCVLTQHDVLANQIGRSRLLRRLTAALERRALQSAHRVVVVSASDAEYFAALGIATTVIPNPVDLTRVQGVPATAARGVLLERHGITLPEGPLCLFVGSRFAPNMEAAARMGRLADEVREASFVVAGACAAPERRGNFLAVGPVSDAALAALYAAADLVLVPLQRGGGSSLKTVEAMAAGKPVLGTSVAFRGLTVAPGEAGILDDEWARWPTLIRELMAAPERRAAIGATARRVAEELDATRVLRGYLPLLGLHDAGAA